MLGFDPQSISLIMELYISHRLADVCVWIFLLKGCTLLHVSELEPLGWHNRGERSTSRDVRYRNYLYWGGRKERRMKGEIRECAYRWEVGVCGLYAGISIIQPMDEPQASRKASTSFIPRSYRGVILVCSLRHPREEGILTRMACLQDPGLPGEQNQVLP